MVSNDHPGEVTDCTQFEAFLTAVRFLTIVPVSRGADRDYLNFPQAIYHFISVGLLIGVIGYILSTLCLILFPPSVTAWVVVFYLAGISGFLHLDGLADSGDGLLSAQPPERSLEIMKDSRTGSMGAVTLLLVVLGKYAALTSLPADILPTVVLVVPIAGRTAILLTMAAYPYARPEGGIGGMFYSSRAKKAAMIAGISLLIISLLILGPLGSILVGVSLVSTVIVFSSWCKTKIGGATGDTLGAVCELSEMTMILSLTVTI